MVHATTGPLVIGLRIELHPVTFLQLLEELLAAGLQPSARTYCLLVDSAVIACDPAAILSRLNVRRSSPEFSPFCPDFQLGIAVERLWVLLPNPTLLPSSPFDFNGSSFVTSSVISVPCGTPAQHGECGTSAANPCSRFSHAMRGVVWHPYLVSFLRCCLCTSLLAACPPFTAHCSSRQNRLRSPTAMGIPGIPCRT